MAENSVSALCTKIQDPLSEVMTSKTSRHAPFPSTTPGGTLAAANTLALSVAAQSLLVVVHQFIGGPETFVLGSTVGLPFEERVGMCVFCAT